MSPKHIEADLQAVPGTPRWVKGFGIVVLVLVLLAGVMLLAGGEHGPNRHMPPAGMPTSQTPAVGHQGQHP